MKKTLLCLLVVFIGIVPLSAQYANLIEKSIDKPRFQLYSTENFWNFIKLDTSNGKMWLVQFSVDKQSSRFESVLNGASLLDTAHGEEPMNGRFVLYPTQNTYNFILLDVVSGQTYQVQWSIDRHNRMIIPIILE